LTDILRVIARRQESARCIEAPVCSMQGCSRKTTCGKPYCTDHVLCHPYAARVRGLHESALSEQRRAVKNGAKSVRTGGITAQDVIQIVKSSGVITVKQLRRSFGLTPKAADVYVAALVGRKILKASKHAGRAGGIRTELRLGRAKPPTTQSGAGAQWQQTLRRPPDPGQSF